MKGLRSDACIRRTSQVRGKYARTVGLANARPDDPAIAAEVDQLRAEYRFLSAANYIKQLVDAAPPLSDTQRDKLALILRGTVA